jgi:hypothetical protein
MEMNSSSETGLLSPVNIHTLTSFRVNYYNYANIDFQYPKVVQYAFTIFIITNLISQKSRNTMPEFHLPSYKTREEQIKDLKTPAEGAHRIYRWVQDMENWGRSLRAVFWKKAQYLSRKICYSFPGQDTCCPGLSI